jgi:hypothetical protein
VHLLQANLQRDKNYFIQNYFLIKKIFEINILFITSKTGKHFLQKQPAHWKKIRLFVISKSQANKTFQYLIVIG